MTDNADAHQYEIEVDGRVAGFIQYRSRPGIVAMIHTEVDSDFEGRGVGGELVRGALDDARNRKLEVLPFCPFVNKFISEHEEYADLVPEAMRGQFGLA